MLRAASDIETGALDALVQIGTGRGRMPTPVVRTVGPAQGTLSVGYVSIPLPLTYGSNRILSRFSLTADRSNDHLVTAITLTNEGKAHNADLQNLFITSSDGKRLTDIVTSLDGDTLRFDFDPALRIGKNSGRMFVLRGDIRASRRQTIEFRIQEPSDIEATVARGRTTTAP